MRWAGRSRSWRGIAAPSSQPSCLAISGWMPAGLLFQAIARSSGEGKRSFEEDRLILSLEAFFYQPLLLSLLFFIGSSFLANLLGVDREGSLMATLGIGQRNFH